MCYACYTSYTRHELHTFSLIKFLLTAMRLIRVSNDINIMRPAPSLLNIIVLPAMHVMRVIHVRHALKSHLHPPLKCYPEVLIFRGM